MDNYYSDKVSVLRDIFGAHEVLIQETNISIDGAIYPVIDDVIVLLEPEFWTKEIRERLGNHEPESVPSERKDFSSDIQKTFGSEWQKYPDILPDYEEMFSSYFDIIPKDMLSGARIYDLGCGTGRWSYFLREQAKELIMVDFSEAIFVARRNLRDAGNTLYFLGDITCLPFRENSADLVVSLGVLHHLPVNALEVARSLGKFAPSLLIYLYYIFDNRPPFYRIVFSGVDILRRILCRINNRLLRTLFTWVGAIFLYYPVILLGHVLRPLGLSQHVPLYQGYGERSFSLIRQDVYDRFFTSIEQRFTQKEILGLSDTFSKVTVSDKLPYWHFLCER